MATIEFRINIIDLPDQNGSGTVIPHSFIIINNGAGFVQGYGFAPATPSDPMGPRHIYPDTDYSEMGSDSNGTYLSQVH